MDYLTQPCSLRFALSFVVASLMIACHPTKTSSKHAHGHAEMTGLPDQEKQIAQLKNLSGPTKTKGISGVKNLVGLPLGQEFEGMKGRQMRARELIAQPGAIVAVHQHERRPGFAYMLEGEMVEHRNDHKGPIVRRVGDVAVETTGVSHWWENRTDKIARAIVVDIVPIK
ncbi:MAG TPA: hypothetical protein DCQ06_08945 [Myxococcales bacterium]|nr:hypothetical protein [Myxococcales bacterium]